MSSSLLRSLHAIGERMHAALNEDDLDVFFELVEKRGMLLDSLKQYDHPAEVDPDWEHMASVLAEQYEALSAAITEREQQMQDELEALERYKGAQQRYENDRYATGGRILNEDLCG